MASVLVADDNPDLRMLIALFVNRTEGLVVAGEAGDGARAISLAHSLRPDVVVLDLDMPKLSGWEALPEIRRRVPQTKVIVYSAMISGGDVEKLIGLGAHAVLTKLKSVRDLIDLVTSVIEDQGQAGRGPARPGVA